MFVILNDPLACDISFIVSDIKLCNIYKKKMKHLDFCPYKKKQNTIQISDKNNAVSAIQVNQLANYPFNFISMDL